MAFIEVAWRRYTKHSRNKAQEIQGAILPLAEKHKWNNPFLGGVLAGEFTDGSLDQLRSLGFQVLYFPYDSLVAAFTSENIDIRFDEDTPDRIFRQAAKQIESAPEHQTDQIISQLIRQHQDKVDHFLLALRQRLSRQITRVIVIPLYGRSNEFGGIESAIKFLDQHALYEASGEFRKYEIQVEFSNSDRVLASLDSKQRVRDFLSFVSQQ